MSILSTQQLAIIRQCLETVDLCLQYKNAIQIDQTFGDLAIYKGDIEHEIYESVNFIVTVCKFSQEYKDKYGLHGTDNMTFTIRKSGIKNIIFSIQDIQEMADEYVELEEIFSLTDCN